MDALRLLQESWLPTILLLILLYKLVNLFYHTGQARRTGLPYTVVPFLETEVISKLFLPLARPLFIQRLLRDEGWPRWIRFSIPDWPWEDKRRAHDEFGDVFLVVSPEGIICYSADAEMGWDVMNRRSEFIKPRDKYKVLEMYGPNVATTEGKDFNFHLRITAPPFNDGSGANDLVWEEAASQTRALAEAWTRDGTKRDLSLDISRLTLGVFAYTGLGQKLDFKVELSDHQDDIPKGFKMTLHRALHMTVIYMVRILLIPKWLMHMLFMKDIAVAHGELEKYMREIIRAETAKINSDVGYQSGEARGNLLTSVLRASAQEASATKRNQAFTENEVLGNLFLYLLAGHETTANAIHYGLISLALHQDLQDKVISEVDRVHQEAYAQGRTALTYADDFDKFKYTFGFMYEIFRLYPIVQLITKMVPRPTSISVYPEKKPPRQYTLPAECRVYLNGPAVQYTERYWPEPYEIKPERWMDTANIRSEIGDRDGGAVGAVEKQRQTKGTFLTFSGGGRSCLGRKFAYAEFISVLATLLRECRVELGEGSDLATVKRQVTCLSAGAITLAPVKHVKLIFKERDRASQGS